MAKKQNDYLASLLADDAPPLAVESSQAGIASPSSALSTSAASKRVPAPTEAQIAPSVPERSTGRTGLSLLARESALARVASGEVRQVTQLLIDPARVRVWNGNARIQNQLSEDNCSDLINSIVAEGGQKVPAVVRHISGDPAHDYELIAGTRRHFAISWLRANNYPDMKLLAQVAELDDEAAFRLADIENRARKDISDIERARNYAEAIDQHYGGKAVRMAERLNLSKGWLSKMLKAATVPDEVMAAFAHWTELPLNPAYKLALAMDDKHRAKAIANEAGAIASENRRNIAGGRPPLSGASVLLRLMAATAGESLSESQFRMEIGGPLGRPILSVRAVNRQGVTLHLPMASGASDEEIAEAVKQVLASLRHSGVSVR